MENKQVKVDSSEGDNDGTGTDRLHVKTHLVEDRHQLSSLHRQVVLVLAVVAVQNYELAVGVFEEWMYLRLRGGLREQGAAPRLTRPDIELQTGVLETVRVARL